MKLTQLAVNSPVEIILIFGTRKLSFPCKILSVNEKSGEIITTVFRLTEGALVFDNSPVALDLRAADSHSKPFLWKNVRIKKTTHGSKMAYLITSPGEGYMDNRREAFRVPVSQQAIVQIGPNRPTDYVILRDISATGIAFIMKVPPEKCIGQEVRINFDDFTYNASFALKATIVRIVPLQGDTYIIGCKLKFAYPSVEKYIAAKQTMQKEHKKGAVAK